MAVYARIARSLRRGLFPGLLALATVWSIGSLWTNSADGYVLEGPHVLTLMAGKFSGVKALRVNQLVTVEDPAISGEPVALDETLSFIFPGNFRSDILHLNSRRIHVVSQGQTITIVDNKITGNPQGHYDQYKDLLLYNSPHMLQKILYTHGVDVGITSLGRLGDQVVFVIGANYPDESVSQVWVDKDQFFPLRWLSVRPGRELSPEDDRWEFVYSNWQKVDGAYYPFKIETFHNRQRIRLIRVIKADANAILDAELFNIVHLQSTYQMQEIPASPVDDQPPSEVDEVQRTIDEFKKKFEP
jgi:outer membrane lipoprotein-sorting protein